MKIALPGCKKLFIQIRSQYIGFNREQIIDLYRKLKSQPRSIGVRVGAHWFILQYERNFFYSGQQVGRLITLHHLRPNHRMSKDDPSIEKVRAEMRKTLEEHS